MRVRVQDELTVNTNHKDKKQLNSHVHTVGKIVNNNNIDWQQVVEVIYPVSINVFAISRGAAYRVVLNLLQTAQLL